MKKRLGTFRITVPNDDVRREIEGGFTTERGPDTQHDLIIEADLDLIANRLGYRAVRSKGGKSTALGGLLVVRELRR